MGIVRGDADRLEVDPRFQQGDPSRVPASLVNLLPRSTEVLESLVRHLPRDREDPGRRAGVPEVRGAILLSRQAQTDRLSSQTDRGVSDQTDLAESPDVKDLLGSESPLETSAGDLVGDPARFRHLDIDISRVERCQTRDLAGIVPRDVGVAVPVGASVRDDGLDHHE